MKEITIEGFNSISSIHIGAAYDKLQQLLPRQGVFIITDENVARFYRDIFPSFPVYETPPGEKSKEMGAVARVYHWLLENGADRSSFILAIGGGVVCDMAGFVASTFMRGLNFGFVATSLLAQVDASVGGKNGVNLDGYKNIVGTFNQPSFVLCDTRWLKTLPEEEYRNGLAEIIKHALIKDEKKLRFLEENVEKVLARDAQAIDYLVTRSVEIKAAVVQADEREKGERRLLNFGHTWGHAIEKVASMPHGQAVSIGMVFAAGLSVQKGLITPEDNNRIVQLLKAYGLPDAVSIDKFKVFDAMLKDKKKDKDKMHFVLLEKPGHAIVSEMLVDELKAFAFGENN